MPDRERIYVACDVSNLWKSCREQYGHNYRLDFQVLGSLVAAKRHPKETVINQVAYIVTNPKQKHHAFYTALRGYGFLIRERFMRFDKDKGRPTHTDWDVGITIDALDKFNDYDTFVLASGDGDFSQLLKHLKYGGKKSMVITFSNSTSRSLYEAADEVISIGKDSVYSV